MKYRVGLVLLLSAIIVLALVVAVQGAEAAVETQEVPNAAPSELDGIPEYVEQSACLGYTDELTYTTYLPLVLNNYFPPYLDDFSDPDSGWYVHDDGDIRWSYQSGEYEIRLRGSYWWAWASAPIVFPEDYIVEADMRRYSGNVAYGLIFGMQDGSHFYVLIVHPESRYYYLVKVVGDDWPVLDYGYSTYISSYPYSTNHLKVKRDGNQIYAYVNGHLVASESDSSYIGSLYGGFYAESGPTAPAVVRFDDFQLNAAGTVTAVSEGFSSRGADRPATGGLGSIWDQ